MGGTNNCVTTPLIAPYGRPGSACKPGPACLLNSNLKGRIDKMELVLGRSSARNVYTWQVTGMFPGNVEHTDSCHTAGSCVDMAINASSPNPEQVANFIANIDVRIGPNFFYEVANETRKKQLVDYMSSRPKDLGYSTLKDKVKTKDEIKSTRFTGEHAHVRYP